MLSYGAEFVFRVLLLSSIVYLRYSHFVCSFSFKNWHDSWRCIVSALAHNYAFNILWLYIECSEFGCFSVLMCYVSIIFLIRFSLASFVVNTWNDASRKINTIKMIPRNKHCRLSVSPSLPHKCHLKWIFFLSFYFICQLSCRCSHLTGLLLYSRNRKKNA